jgi:hypothetical protein
MSASVREEDAIEDELVAAVTEADPFGDHRRLARISPAAALAHLRARIARTAAEPDAARLVARDAGGAPAGLLLLEPLPQDTDVFGTPMAGIPFALVRGGHPAGRDVLGALLAALPDAARRRGIRHVSTRVDTADLVGTEELLGAGFRLIETLVTMAYDTELRGRGHQGRGEVDCAEYGFDGRVRLGGRGDGDAVAGLARESFTRNRFHRDSNLPADRAAELMARWARSYCEDGEDCQVWIAERADGRLAGFLGHRLDRELERHSGVLVSGRALLAVKERREGVGQMLSRAHVLQSPGDYKEADTQLENFGMIRIGFHLGMDLVRTKYTLHRSF